MKSSVQTNRHHVFNSLRSSLVSSSSKKVNDDSTQELDILDQVISSVPDALTQATDTLNVGNSGSSAKEKIESTTPDTKALETGQTVSYVEAGPVSPEISPEVEGYLEEVRENIAQAPKEIVVADGQVLDPGVAKASPTPVVVIPITKEKEKEGEKKSPNFSIRWLVEWSRKMMKMFVGQVVYQEDQA